MVNFLVSIILGMLPEVIFFTLFLIYTKNIKEKKLKLFCLIAIAYILCIMVSRLKIIYYMGLIITIYFILKILYKDKIQIIDIFVISLASIYLTLSTYICFIFLKSDYSNYYILYIINRVLLFLIFIFKNKFNILYKKYCNLWNRNYEKKQPIKSITLRNITLIIVNIAIVITNIIAIAIINL